MADLIRTVAKDRPSRDETRDAMYQFLSEVRERYIRHIQKADDAVLIALFKKYVRLANAMSSEPRKCNAYLISGGSGLAREDISRHRDVIEAIDNGILVAMFEG